MLLPERLLDRMKYGAGLAISGSIPDRQFRFAARPSMVVTARPFAWTASKVQDFTARPSSRTVQAPHILVSQPMCVPVRRGIFPNQVHQKAGGFHVGRKGPPLRVREISIFVTKDRGPEPKFQ